MSLDEALRSAWSEWLAEMTGEQGLKYYEDIKGELFDAFTAGWSTAPLRVFSVKLDGDSE